MRRQLKQKARVAAAVVAAAGGMAATGATAAEARPAARKAPTATVDRLVVPRGVTAHWGRMTASARVRLRVGGPARLSVAFHLSRDRRWDRRDHRLGAVRTRRLARGRAATVRLRTRMSSTVDSGRWKLLACVGAAARRRCAVSAITVRRPVNDAVDDGPRPVPPGPDPRPGPSDPFRDIHPALQLDDGVEWGTRRRADGAQVGPGDTVTTTLRLGATLPGGAGYVRENRPSGTAVGGRETVLLDAATAPPGADLDDDAVVANLPFAFPFAGVRTSVVSVSTNGWLSTAGPAFDNARPWRRDYRGVDQSLGANVAAIAPLWEDLTLAGPAGSEPGRLVLVEARGGDAVAVRWEVYPAAGDDATERGRQIFQAVLSSDGSIRFDYLDRAAVGPDFEPSIGVSPGVTGGRPQLDTAVSGPPVEGLLFVPVPFPRLVVDPLPGRPAPTVSRDVPAGSASLTLPRGSAFAGGSPGCRLAVAPTLSAEGRVDCDTPVVPFQASATVDVTWTHPPAFVGAVEQQAVWRAHTRTLTADAELLERSYGDGTGTTVDLIPETPVEGAKPGLYVMAMNPGAVIPLRHPLLTGTLAPGLGIVALKAAGVRVDGAELAAACPQLPAGSAGGAFACRLPNGIGLNFNATVVLEEAAAGSYPVSVALDADNVPSPPGDAGTLVVP